MVAELEEKETLGGAGGELVENEEDRHWCGCCGCAHAVSRTDFPCKDDERR